MHTLNDPAVHNGSSRRGITLLEVMVVIAVIALLLTLILPAIQAAREVSRRATCTSNLRQLGMGIADYEAVRRRYPMDDGNIPPPAGHIVNAWSEYVELLPHVDAGNVYNAIDFDGPIDGIWSQPFPDVDVNPALATRLPLLLCPSDQSEEGNNYRFCAGSNPGMAGGDGAFAWHQTESGRSVRPRPALVTDGQSHTVAMSEKLVMPPGGAWSRHHSFWYSGYNALMGYPNNRESQIPPDEMMDVCRLTPDDPVSWHPYAGQSWSQRFFPFVLYNHVAPPNSSIPDCTPWSGFPNSWIYRSIESPTGGMFTARSWHSGGVNVLYLDGHVAFISDSVDLAVWRGMASIDGGELF